MPRPAYICLALCATPVLNCSPDHGLPEPLLSYRGCIAGGCRPLQLRSADTGGRCPLPHRQKVPPLPEGITWLNTTGPLEWKDLRGKFVLVDFWTYCCINCMHILPELKRLEHAYPKNLVVLGVHSAKFEAEQDTENIGDAILRYKIEHPVINDAQHVLWDRFGVNSWPTVILIDPEGYAVWGTAGEITRGPGGASAAHRRWPIIASGISWTSGRCTSIPWPARRRLRPCGSRARSLPTWSGGRLLVADSNHNRLVMTRWRWRSGDHRFGIGRAGRRRLCHGPIQPAARDGPPRQPTFRGRHGKPRHPQGRSADAACHDRGRHRAAGPRDAGGRERGNPRKIALEQPVGSGDSRRRPVHRHGRLSSDLENAVGRQFDRSLCGQRPRRHRRWAALAATGLSAGLCGLCAAQRTGQQRHVAVCGRQRGQFDSRGAAGWPPRRCGP